MYQLKRHDIVVKKEHTTHFENPIFINKSFICKTLNKI